VFPGNRGQPRSKLIPPCVLTFFIEEKRSLFEHLKNGRLIIKELVAEREKAKEKVIIPMRYISFS